MALAFTTTTASRSDICTGSRIQMESIEVHSKDFLIRWVEVEATSRITWKIIPIKRSINFGVFLHNEKLTANDTLAGATGNIVERLESSGFTPVTTGGLSRIEARESTEGSSIVDRKNLLAFVFDNTFSISNSKHVQLCFNIEPLSPLPAPSGSSFTDVSEVSGQSNKTPALTAAAAASNHHPDAAATSESKSDPVLAPFPQVPQVPHPTHTDFSSSSSVGASRKLSMSKSSLPDAGKGPSNRRNTHSSASGAPVVPNGPSDDDEASAKRPRHRGSGINSFSSVNDCEVMKSLDGRYVNGFLQKKRRKQFQGFARRYFTLDKQTGLLNYYLNNRSRSLRGVMPIKIAQVKADHQTLQFTLNSGMEKWTLKASDQKTLAAWCAELKEVRRASAQDESELESEDEIGSLRSPGEFSNDIRRVTSRSSTIFGGALPKPGQSLIEVPALEDLRVSISRLQDTTRKLFEGIYLNIIKETLDLANKSSGGITPKLPPKKIAALSRPSHSSRHSQATLKPIERSPRGFAKRAHLLILQIQSRNFLIVSSLGLFVGACFGLSHALTVFLILIIAAGGNFAQFRSYAEGGSFDPSDPTGEYLAEAYGGANVHLDNGSKPSLAPSGLAFSGGSAGSDEDDEDNDFSDLSDEDEKESTASVSYVPQKPTVKEAQSTSPDDLASQRDTKLASSAAAAALGAAGVGAAVPKNGASTGETAETSHYPLPHPKVSRRTQIEAPAHQPPSLLSLLKKAKDPSNMTAPITSNEPLSAVEVVAEMFEYADLLDAASRAAPGSNLRLSMVALFAVARISGIRIKERALRKPFTPLLGETYELVREDLGFRFLAEKVIHKPEVVATQAESSLWTVHYTSRPHSKMWAKSIQLTDVGHFSVTFPDGESVSFMNPEMFIRNIIAGERYVEPTGSITVESSQNSQATALVEFKAGGMFSGRSEEVKITSGKIVYEGKWTESMHEGGNQVWAVKPMVDNASKHYGWPVFTAQLNEITELEKNTLPPNDSRLRPDLRIYEHQKDVEHAEEIKLNLEQKQRERRKELEVAGKQHEPFFFVKSKDSRGHYILRHGERNYWVQRQHQNWSSVPNYFKE